MKFTTQLILILLMVLIVLAIFLYSLNDKIAHQIQEEADETTLGESFNPYNTDIYNMRDPHPDLTPGDCPNLLVNKGDILFLYNTTRQDDPLVRSFRSMDEYQQYVVQQQNEGKSCPLLYLRQEVNTQGNEVFRMYTEATLGPGASPTGKVPVPDPRPTMTESSLSAPSADAQKFGQQGRPPMPPPFLESVPMWDLHHQPPLYVEGGLPALPIEKLPVGPIVTQDAVTNTNPKFNQTGLHSYDPYGLYVGRFTDVDVLHKKSADTTAGYSGNAADSNWGGVMYSQQQVREHQYSGSEVARAIYPQMGFV